jgi:hypothetical protein
VLCEIVWTNIDDPADRKVVKAYGEGPSHGKGGGQPQHLGSAESYAVKFAQLKNFLLVGDDTPNVESYPAPPASPDPGPPTERKLSASSQNVLDHVFAENVERKLSAIRGVNQRPALRALVQQISHPAFADKLSSQQRDELLDEMKKADKRLMEKGE